MLQQNAWSFSFIQNVMVELPLLTHVLKPIPKCDLVPHFLKGCLADESLPRLLKVKRWWWITHHVWLIVFGFTSVLFSCIDLRFNSFLHIRLFWEVKADLFEKRLRFLLYLAFLAPSQKVLQLFRAHMFIRCFSWVELSAWVWAGSELCPRVNVF